MHACLIHANIVVGVITLRKGFNADQVAMMDRSSPVCIVQLQLVSVSLSTETTVHACMHACALVHAHANLHCYLNICTISDCCIRDDTIISIHKNY